MSPTIENLNDPLWWNHCAPEAATHWGESGGFYKLVNNSEWFCYGMITRPHPSIPMGTEKLAGWKPVFTHVDKNKLHKRPDHIVDASKMVKQIRYQDQDGGDWIDEFARTATKEEFRGAMRFTIGKYNRRMGKKDDMISEIGKMEDYCRRWREYELKWQEDEQ